MPVKSSFTLKTASVALPLQRTENFSYMHMISLSYSSCIGLPFAAYFHLYGIEHDDMDYMMETFPIVKRKDEKLYGEYRTKRVILEMYDEMKRAREMGEAYRTRLVPGPGDGAVEHAPRATANIQLF